MTITTLKILALVFMTIDHIGAIFFQDIIWLRYIGRLSAPIFIFCIAEALKHTSDRKKYVIKLFTFSRSFADMYYRYGKVPKRGMEEKAIVILYISDNNVIFTCIDYEK